ncbi:spore coat polysaccharide biosynthesis predicted glycosyltransferase SpsG [Streptosporangium album]|uniref:Spore coat polysaccharide biosynthesis predicted glycosyltransferase SpsG n=1 Tax=Streptosporangium album TaxID=47479 RepID=A0A7W7RWY6_9ACTN|nr:spore coat protein [Streptosporangium album]MBB4939685.1 spore coat polysaccharide biosynthesis predicted glycosyltransferase SpsG [Streptosporangium album]
MNRVGIRCDASTDLGVGHLMRCLALAEELRERCLEVVVLGDVGGLDWARRQLARRGLPLLPGPDGPAAMVRTARRLALDAVVIDSYALDPRCSGALREAGVRVLAIVDEDDRGQDADIYLDQNLGAERGPGGSPAGSVRLAGVRYALLRDDVRRLRRREPAEPGGRWTGEPGQPPRVLCFFGGTDAAGAAPVIAGELVATGAPFLATVVTPREGALDRLGPADGQTIHRIPPTDDLPRLVAAADLVVTAAGSSMWELLYLGKAAALVWVAENQRPAYEEVVSHGLAAGLGHLDGVTRADGPARACLRELLTRARTRAELGARGPALVDGEGRVRVADVLLSP